VKRGIATALFALAFGCSQAIADDLPPITPGYKPAADSDEGGLWMMADQSEQSFKTSPALVKDAALNAYIDGLVCKLAKDHCADIRVYVLDIPYFNAAMSPNGAMQVWTGLLLRAHNEAQLACVLGHEISHYELRHTVAEWRRARDTTGAMAVIAIVTAGAGVGLVGSLANLAAMSSLMSYSRDEERAADSYGQDMAYAAGYDPSECATLWREQMAEDQADPQHSDNFQFLKSHPATDERLETMQKRAADVAAAASGHVRAGTESFRAAMTAFRSQWLNEELARAHYAESIVLVQELLKAEPNSAEFEFYLGEVYRQRNAPDDSTRALTAYRTSVALGSAPPSVYRGLGLTEMKAGDKTDARDDFKHYLTAAPAADDRAMVQFYLTQLGDQT
jgi:predicted Zn-dependent protease